MNAIQLVFRVTKPILGCDTGFGHLIALDLNSCGFTVFAGCLAPEKDEAKSLQRKCEHRDKLIIVPINVTSEESINQAHDLVRKRLDQDNLKLHALVNNAGIASVSEFEWGSFDQEIKSVLNVNVIGLALVTRKFLPLIRKFEGRIINMNSVASRFSPPGMISYDMSKHATLAFTECLRREMFKFKVRVISIEPFFYKTNIVDTERCLKSALNAWENTDASIRADYGEDYFKNFLSFNSSTTFTNLQRDPIEVANEVNHAISARYPKMSYACTGYFWRFVQWYMASFNHPQESEEMGWNFGSVLVGCHKPTPR